jgi:hypothetical protein
MLIRANETQKTTLTNGDIILSLDNILFYPSTEYPPSTGIAVPVMKSDARLDRKTAMPDKSSGTPQRPVGVRSSTRS